MFSNRKKLLLGGSVLVAVLLVAGGYYVSRWLFSPNVESVTEYVLPDEPLPEQRNRPVRASISQVSSSMSKTDLMSEGESFSDNATSTTDTDEIDEEALEALISELEVLEQDEVASSDSKGDFPEMPDGFPFTPVWLEYPNYQKGDKHDHELISRVLIKLWNQGDHDFVNGVHENGKVYPLYNDVMYVEWDTRIIDGPDGPIEFNYIASSLGTHARDDIEENYLVSGGLFTIEEMISGAYKTKYPNLKLVDYQSAGYDPATFLDD